MTPKKFSHLELVKKFPSEVKKIFEVFGEEIRLVGGSVRDLLLQKKVNDFDFATKFIPEKITKILEKNKIKAVPTGAKFGTITAVLNGRNFEITTLRKDNETDGRHCEPEFVDDYFLDAARRDFTINALYLDSKGLITDYFDGISDLKNQKVRFIGDAKKRIEEDFLRILRFFRFSAEYAKKLDLEGLEACISQKENLKKLSKERIRAEFLKLISGKKKENILAILEILKNKKIAEEIFSPKLEIKRLEKLFSIQAESNLELKIAALFLNKKIDLDKFYKEICATNSEKKFLNFIFSKISPKLYFQDLKLLLAFEEKELILNLYLFKLAQESFTLRIPEITKNLKYLEQFSLPKFPLNGKDFIRLGYKQKAIGEAITKAKKIWAENNFKISKSELVKFIRE
jgi:poly(A) polymerase